MCFQKAPRSSNRSAWTPVLLGCLALALAALAGLGYLAYKGAMMARQIASAASTSGGSRAQHSAPPANPAVVAKQFAGIPVYPGAILDAHQTGALGQRMQAFWKKPSGGRTAGDPVAAVYSVSDTPYRVAKWYDRQMRGAGWTLRWAEQSGPKKLLEAYAQRPWPDELLDAFAQRANPNPRGAYERGREMLALTATPVGSATRLHLLRMRVPAGLPAGKTPQGKAVKGKPTR